jgi:hypothetical protein
MHGNHRKTSGHPGCISKSYATAGITLRIDDHLPQTNVIGRRPSADHVNRGFIATRVETPPQRLPVNRHDLPIGNVM